MRRRRVVRQFLRPATAWLLTVTLSPLVVVAGEPLRRYVMARPSAMLARPVTRQGWPAPSRRHGQGRWPSRTTGLRPRSADRWWRRRQFLLLLVSNPLWIALTAPARWLLDRAAISGRRSGGRSGRSRPPDSGVREPRRPRPDLPGSPVALAEPRADPVIARLLGTASRGPGKRQDERGGRRRTGGRRRGDPAC